MVRLEDSNRLAVRLPLFVFQFQNGTIRSSYEIGTRETKINFNSKMVRLEVPLNDLLASRQPNFNSKMVRLEVELPFSYTYQKHQFQFQNGTIRRCGHRSHLGTNTIISIPKWYD